MRSWMSERRTEDGRQRRKEMKVALILLVVNGTFIICWLPHFVGMMCLTFTDGSCPFPDSFFIITTTLAMLNSGCNPFIYTLTYRKFRKAFKRVLPCFRSDHTGNMETSVN
ncbi:alpha-2Db adrenergic receptor-like [Oculina patagonica]